MVMRTFRHSLFVLIAFSSLACKDTGNTNVLSEYAINIITERAEKDKSLIAEGVIEDELIAGFKGLQYFDVDTNYKIEAKIEMLPRVKVVFKTTTDRTPEYYTFCRLHFKVSDSAVALTAYTADSVNVKQLFVPFRDRTSNKSTYGGGRYLDISYLSEKETMILDFNKAYNPYCHYNHNYSCPLVPFENSLTVAIFAGEKKLHD